MVQAFRREESPFESAHLRLRGLNPKARYSVANFDDTGESVFTGSDLMDNGVPAAIADSRLPRALEQH